VTSFKVDGEARFVRYSIRGVIPRAFDNVASHVRNLQAIPANSRTSPSKLGSIRSQSDEIGEQEKFFLKQRPNI
jgi:hypothetical protein